MDGLNLSNLLPETQERIMKRLIEFRKEEIALQERIDIFIHDEIARDALIRGENVIFKENARTIFDQTFLASRTSPLMEGDDVKMQQFMDKLRIMAKESLIEMKAKEDPEYVKRKADRTLRIKMIQMEGHEDFEKTKQKYKEIIENSDQSEIDKEVHKMVVKYSNRQSMNL